MRTITFRTMPGVTSCGRSATDGALLVLVVSAMEGSTALVDCAFRLPTGTDPVEGRDPIETIGAAVGNDQPLLVTAAVEWSDELGCWDLLLVDEIVDPRDVPVAATLLDDACDVALRGLEIAETHLRASFDLTIPIERLDEEAQTSAIGAQDARILPLDGIDDADWRVDVLDHDEGPRLAWWSISVTARSPKAIKALDAELARRTPWKRASAGRSETVGATA